MVGKISVMVVSLLFLSLAFKAAMDYESAPGRAANPPLRDQPNHFLVFVHPRCSCTESTLRVVEQILEQSPALRCEVIFVCPPGAPRDFPYDRMWEQARGLARTRLVVDREGRLANLMGVYTSGQALYYDARGELLYSGGLTIARADEDPYRANAILNKVPSRVPVYGCPLFEELCRGPAKPPR